MQKPGLDLLPLPVELVKEELRRIADPRPAVGDGRASEHAFLSKLGMGDKGVELLMRALDHFPYVTHLDVRGQSVLASGVTIQSVVDRYSSFHMLAVQCWLSKLAVPAYFSASSVLFRILSMHVFNIFQ